LYRSHGLLALITLCLSVLVAVRALQTLQRAEVASHMETLAALVARVGETELAGADVDGVRRVVARLGQGLEARLTVIGPDGVVWADNWADADVMENHGTRAEVVEARAAGKGSAIRYSDTVHHDLLYVGMAVTTKQGPVVVRAARPLAWLAKDRRLLGREVLLAMALIGALALVLAWWLARRVGRVLERIGSGVRRFAGGDLTHRIPIPAHDELIDLVEGMNSMAAALEQRLRQLQDRHEEEGTILGSMVEGLVAVDRDQHVIKANAAAADLLRMDARQAEGRSLQEVTRHAGLQRLVARVLDSGTESHEELTVRNGDDRIVAAHGCLLRNGDGEPVGAVVVLHDITRLRRLEQMRREFVANVSHELKTPVTSIRGFVETLREGAMDDPEQARKFLDILSRQSARLQRIIEDLLTLSRLETGSDDNAFPRECVPIRPVLEAALQLADAGCRDSGVPPPRIECPDELEACINPPLLEQAVMNLVDNAVKHGGGDQPVTVRACREGDVLLIEVQDHGVGIPRDHLPRVFERFYRVDKGRSRDRGGTGLGLSIVKHIAQAHGGSAEVESRPGRGATFRLRLPADA
jgi:two-component system phosphate regulon sensor histidine kinase PhoR